MASQIVFHNDQKLFLYDWITILVLEEEKKIEHMKNCIIFDQFEIFFKFEINTIAFHFRVYNNDENCELLKKKFY